MLLPRGTFFAIWCMIVATSFFGFTSYTYNKAFAVTPPPAQQKKITGTYTKTLKCQNQKTITDYMKQRRYRIMFNWMSPDGKLIKLLAVNKKAQVILVHIINSKSACVIDEFGEGTWAPKAFFGLFGLIPDKLNRNHRKGKKL